MDAPLCISDNESVNFTFLPLSSPTHFTHTTNPSKEPTVGFVGILSGFLSSHYEDFCCLPDIPYLISLGGFPILLSS